jgi:hypothetical protein
MNSFQTVEIFGVIIIIAIQSFVFIKTLSDIYRFRRTFDIAPSVIKLDIPISHLDSKTPVEIISSYSQYIHKPNVIPVKQQAVGVDGMYFQDQDFEDENDEEEQVGEETKEIHLIIPGKRTSGLFERIITSINVYLIKNRGAASDFHLIKDVVERNADTQEGQISHSISVPLYLGLLGTMFGIVFGLFNISDLGDSLASDSKMNDGISILLGGVKVAMMASFTGLAFTVINSGWLYKNAKFLVETKKNDFYTFIQTELLPVLNQNINSTLYSLQTNLFKFNDDFTTNIKRLNGIMDKNYDALIAQERILSTIDRLDVTELAKANVKVLKELQNATEKFAVFNSYLGNVNEMVSNSRDYVGKMNELLGRTDNLNSLASKIVEAFEFNRKLQEFLQHHYSALENSQQVFDEKLTGVNDVLYQTLDQLKEFIQSKIIEVQQISLKEIELIRDEYPEKWKKLDNLVHLEALNKNVTDIKSSSASQSERLKNELSSLNHKFQEALAELEEIKNNGTNGFSKRIGNVIHKVFGKKQSVDEG